MSISAPVSGRPNLLIILTDQQHSRMMSCAGNASVSTPAMDSLAAGGTRFTRAYCANPVCVPSRFTLFTGRMPSAIGMWGNGRVEGVSKEPYEREGIGWKLREAGYETAYGGKQHFPIGLTAGGLGFEEIETDERDRLAATCADFLRQRTDSARPFCLVASFINPHDICYQAIRDFASSDMDHLLLRKGALECETLDAALKRPDGIDEETFFKEVCPPLPPNFEIQEGEPEAIAEMVRARGFRERARNEYTERQWRLHRWAYKRLTEMVDAQIGRVLDALRESGLEENTVVLFTSDHGDHDGAHRLEHKSTGYEESAGVPLIVSQPGVTVPGRVDDTHLVSNGLDLIPTLCDYAGIPVPGGLEGQSLRPLAEGRPVEGWREVVRVESSVCRMIVTGRYKYALHHTGERAEQLFDLEHDPGEMRNAAGDPEMAEVLEAHRRRFREVFPGPVPVPA